jgi:hypothetical protein
MLSWMPDGTETLGTSSRHSRRIDRMPKCPDCNEPGELHLVHTYPGGFSQRKCSRCGGTNQITEAEAEAIRQGAILRQARVKRCLSTREAAGLIGVPALLLSRVETGVLGGEEDALRERLIREMEGN